MTSKLSEYTTDILPPPRKTIDPKFARVWLEEDLPGLYLALRYGYDAEEKATRESFYEVSGDLYEIVQACVHAIVWEEPVHVVRRCEPGDLNFDDRTQDLIRVVTHRCDVTDSDGYFVVGFYKLANVLKARITGESELNLLTSCLPEASPDTDEKASEVAPAAEQPSTESAPQEPRPTEQEDRIREVAEQLSGELSKRLFLMEDLINGGLYPKDEGYDFDIASLGAQSVNLCHVLAAKLMGTGTFDAANSNTFKTEENLTGMLLRLADKKTDGHSMESVMGWLREARDKSIDEGSDS